MYAGYTMCRVAFNLLAPTLPLSCTLIWRAPCYSCTATQVQAHQVSIRRVDGVVLASGALAPGLAATPPISLTPLLSFEVVASLAIHLVQLHAVLAPGVRVCGTLPCTPGDKASGPSCPKSHALAPCNCQALPCPAFCCMRMTDSP